MEININCDLGEKSKLHSNKHDPDLPLVFHILEEAAHVRSEVDHMRRFELLEQRHGRVGRRRGAARLLPADHAPRCQRSADLERPLRAADVGRLRRRIVLLERGHHPLHNRRLRLRLVVVLGRVLCDVVELDGAGGEVGWGGLPADGAGRRVAAVPAVAEPCPQPIAIAIESIATK